MPATLFFLFAALLITFEGSACAESVYEVTAGHADQIKIDGHLEQNWLSGGVVEGFVQRESHYPDPVSLPTKVYLLSDQDALYIGFMCYDTAPDSIRGKIQRRDNDANSDFVDIYLDTFHDRRSGYWYTVTAAGVQAEGTIANENEFTTEWDAVWESAVARSDSGWSCEVRIPFHSLRHGGAREDGWGIAFDRYIERRNERAMWPPVDPQIEFHVSRIGTLYGLTAIASSAHIEILPHAVGRWDAASDSGKWHSENEAENLGFYIKAVPSAAMTIDFAYEPDFAQVDVDAQTINFSDYPIQYAEKRPFFLENKQIFEELPFYLFYFRRISDPDYAGRVNLQKGNLRASVLGGKNRRPDDKLQDAAAGRVVLNFGRVHRVGITSTFLNQKGYSAAAAAVDARFRWREQDRLLLWFSGVNREDTNPYPDSLTRIYNDERFESRAAYLRDWKLFIQDLSATYRGKDYDVNDLGWSDYSNIQRYSTKIYQNYYPRSSFLRFLGYEVNAVAESHTNNTHRQGWSDFRLTGVTNSNWNGGGGVEWNDVFQRYYASDGEFRDNYGRFDTEYYRGWYHWTWLNSDTRKPIEYSHNIVYRGFRGGESFGYEPKLVWKPRTNLQLSQEMSWFRLWDVDGFVEDGETEDYQLWISNVRWSPRLNVSFRGTVQYVQHYHEIQTNLLFAWNWSPGSWFYLVYDETGRNLSEELQDGRERNRSLIESRPGDRTIRAKLTYFFTVP